MSIDALQRKVSIVREETRLRAMNPCDSYSYTNLMSDLTMIVREMVEGVFTTEANALYGNRPVPDFAVFLYGSPARREMTSYSDIDIHIINENRNDVSIELKRRIVESLSSFGFGKIDDPNWESLVNVEHYVARSITEGNQIIDASFVCGDQNIAVKLGALKSKYDTLERNVHNMFFQRFYLDHYYSGRSTNQVPNVKYSVGGYRELLTFDWFDRMMTLYSPNWSRHNKNNPLVEIAIENLHINKIISDEQFRAINRSVEFVTLLRNEMLHVNQGTTDQGITHLDEQTKARVYSSSPEFFRQQGAKDAQDISTLFQRHRTVVRWAKDLMWYRVLANETIRRGPEWRANYDELMDKQTPLERRKHLLSANDQLLQIASVWSAHHLGNEEFFHYVAHTAISPDKFIDQDHGMNWEVLASLACSPLCPPDILHIIGSDLAKKEGLGYILRIIGRNPRTSHDTLMNIVHDSQLDDRYRKVARINLEKGVYAATTRAS